MRINASRFYFAALSIPATRLFGRADEVIE
jgi:hypothetical protein